MRILHLLHQYLPERTGGTELYARSLATRQALDGHEVAIFAPSAAPPGPLPEATVEEAVRVYRDPVGPRGPAQTLLSAFRHPALDRAFAAALAEERPDLVHVQHLLGLPVSLIDRLLAAGIPYVVTLWDFWWVCANAQLLTNDSQSICDGPRAYLNCARCALARAGLPQFPPALPAAALPLAARNARLRPVLAHARRLIAPSAFVGRWYAAHGAPAARLTLLPPGLDYPQEVAARGQRPAGSPLRVGYVGGLAPQKGVHVLVEAFAGLDGPAELWLAGDPAFDPAYVARLRRLAGDNVTFLGRLDRPAVWRMLSQVDVLAVPSLWYETFAFVISEAFAAGVPVLASRLGVLADRVRHDEDGLLLPPGDVAAWRAALARLQRQPALLDRWRAAIQPVPTLADHARQVEALYHARPADG